MNPLRVCIDARLHDGVPGGIQQVIIGLANGLSKLADSSEEYLFLVYPESKEWLKPYVDGPCSFLHVKVGQQARQWQRTLNSVTPYARRLWHSFNPTRFGKRAVGIPRTDGTIESAGIDLMHFTHQGAFLTGIPSIYHPHDLQHLHLPEFFTPRDRLVREVRYRQFCQQAAIIAVASTWIKDDIVRQYQIQADKIKVVPLAPPVAAYPVPREEDIAKAKRKYSLPDTFAFYPAQTWAHKNHLGLIEALAILRDQRQLRVSLVFSGHLNEFYPEIQKRVNELRLNSQVQFLGFISPLELQSIYKMSRCVIIPTKFEAGSFPLWEAFHNGVPVACSKVTSLPAQAGKAALHFNPNNTFEIAHIIETLWCNPELRNSLVQYGKQRIQAFSWERTARIFRAHYRKLARQSLKDEDRDILAAGPLM